MTRIKKHEKTILFKKTKAKFAFEQVTDRTSNDWRFLLLSEKNKGDPELANICYPNLWLKVFTLKNEYFNTNKFGMKYILIIKNGEVNVYDLHNNHSPTTAL